MHEVLEYLKLSPGNKVLDCTVGGGGHAGAILEDITPGGILIGIDQDEDALKTASGRLREFKDNIYLIRENFTNLDKVLSELKVGKVDGVLFDLGLSSLQLEAKERGFSIKQDGPLDMRMDRRLNIDAGYLVNRLKGFEIADILKRFGEERWSGRIAKAIVSNRPIGSTRRLAEIVSGAIPERFRRSRIHPATRTFQAFRIAVNRELEALRSGLDRVIDCIKAGGRICVISFHSLEDRIVKNKYKDFKKRDLLKLITKKPVTPQREEVLINPRARSAKLRVAERI